MESRKNYGWLSYELGIVGIESRKNYAWLSYELGIVGIESRKKLSLTKPWVGNSWDRIPKKNMLD